MISSRVLASAVLVLGLTFGSGCDSKKDAPTAATSEAASGHTATGDHKEARVSADKGADKAGDSGSADKAAVDKAAVDKAAVDKAAVDKAAVDKAAADKAAADKVTADKAAADKAAADKLAADKAAAAAKEDPSTVYPIDGQIVRAPHPLSPGWLITEALAAAMEKDFDTGWERFKALLHSKEMGPNAIKSRKSLNFPASRRKVALFLVEDPAKPFWKVSRVEEVSKTHLKIFVDNPKSMPTPCHVERDVEANNAWRITMCSL